MPSTVYDDSATSLLLPRVLAHRPARRKRLLMMVWTKLPTDGGPVHDAGAPHENPSHSTRCGFLWFRRSLGSKPPRHGSAGRALAPSICPVPWYSDERGGAFSGLVRSRFLKVPRTTSAGKPDANFLLEIKHGPTKVSCRMARGRYNQTADKWKSPGHSAPWASLSVGSGPYRGDPKPWKQATTM